MKSTSTSTAAGTAASTDTSTDTSTGDRVYRSLGIVILAIYLTCAVVGGLVATPYLNAEDQVLVRAALLLGFVGLIPLVWYLAWTLTTLVAKGRIDRDPERPGPSRRR
jgi:hypothetical protein